MALSSCCKQTSFNDSYVRTTQTFPGYDICGNVSSFLQAYLAISLKLFPSIQDRLFHQQDKNDSMGYNDSFKLIYICYAAWRQTDLKKSIFALSLLSFSHLLFIVFNRSHWGCFYIGTCYHRFCHLQRPLLFNVRRHHGLTVVFCQNLFSSIIYGRSTIHLTLPQKWKLIGFYDNLNQSCCCQYLKVLQTP